MIIVFPIYLIATGKVGSKISKNLITLGIRPPKGIYEELSEYKKPYNLPIEIQMIDMARETFIDELVNKGLIINNDHFIQLVFSGDYYKPDILFRTSQYYKYYNLIKYWNRVRSITAYLGPGKGVQRFRPLSRLFTSLKVRELADKIREDYSEDLKMFSDITNVFITSAGGGFGSGSLTTIAALTKHIAQTKKTANVLFANIPLYTRYRIPIEELPYQSHELLKAAVGMFFLELMYLEKLWSAGQKGYKDRLTEKIATDELNLQDPSGFKLYHFDEVVLTGLTNVNGNDINEVFDNHDEKAAMILAFYLSAYDRGKLQPLRDNKRSNNFISNIVNALIGSRLPPSLLMPVHVIGTRYLVLLKSDITDISKKVNELVEKSDELVKKAREAEDELNNLRQEKEKEEKKLEEARARLAEIESAEKIVEIDKIVRILQDTYNYSSQTLGLHAVIQKNAQDALKHLDNLNNLLNYAKSLIKKGNKKDYSTVMEQYEQIIEEYSSQVHSRISTLSSNTKPILEEFERKNLDKLDIIERIYILKFIKYIRNQWDVLAPKLEEIKQINTEIESHAGEDCSLFNRKPCKVRARAHSIKEDIDKDIITVHSNIDILAGLSEQLNKSVQEIKQSTVSHIESLKGKLNTIQSRIHQKSEELESIRLEQRKVAEELKNDVASFVAKLLGLFTIDGQSIIDSSTRTSILRTLLANKDKLVKLLNYKERLYSISGVIDALSEVLGEDRVKQQLLTSISEALKISAGEFDSSHHTLTLPPDGKEAVRNFVAKVAGEDKAKAIEETLRDAFNKQFFVIYTTDNEELVKDLTRGSNRVLIPLESSNTSLIGVIEWISNVPLVSIKEVRDSLKAALHQVKHNVFDVDPTKFYHSDEELQLKEATEPLGLMFSVFDIFDEKFRDFLEQVNQALQQYEG